MVADGRKTSDPRIDFTSSLTRGPEKAYADPRSESLRPQPWAAYMDLRRLKAATSAPVSSNHSPFFRFASNRLCQYASMPPGSSVRIT